MDRIERIKEMEKILDNGNILTENFLKAYDELIAYQGEINRLDDYYSNGAYQEDYLADSRNEIPKDLKRGVLTEDLAYNLLLTNDYIMNKLLKKRKS